MTAPRTPERQRHVLGIIPHTRLHPVLAAVYFQASHIAQDINSYPSFICLLYVSLSQPDNVTFDRHAGSLALVESDH